MKQVPSEPDIQTIYQRIKSGDLDVAPEFQRGEVWAQQKKQRLIDTILRGWNVPPIHVIEDDHGRQEVLDGQQRLAAIRDFKDNMLIIDGSIKPSDPDIAAISGLNYSKLPEDVKRKFNQFTLRIIRITEYKPGEPGELFFRLNQPTPLTAAETRNAYIGTPGKQVHDLVVTATHSGILPTTVGLSTKRLAYADFVARFCAALEYDSLLKRVSATLVTEKYKIGMGFSPDVLNRAHAALTLLGESVLAINKPIRLNKATIHSWLIFLASHKWVRVPPASNMGPFIYRFEQSRNAVRGPKSPRDAGVVVGAGIEPQVRFRALQIFNDRSSSRVGDVFSVMSRDAMIWLLYSFDDQCLRDSIRTEQASVLADVVARLRESGDDEYSGTVVQTLAAADWGNPL